MSKPKVEWGPRPKNRWSEGTKLWVNGVEVGEYFGHEEDGSLSAVREVLQHLAGIGVIDYEAPTNER